jgi:hypothetical protein
MPRGEVTDILLFVAINTAPKSASKARTEQTTCSTHRRASRPTAARPSRDITLMPPTFVEGQSGVEEAVMALAELLDLQLRSEPELDSNTTSSKDDEADPTRSRL